MVDAHILIFRTELKKSGERTPRVELVEIGPSFDLTIRRVKFASEDLFKLACTKKRPVSERGRVCNIYLPRDIPFIECFLLRIVFIFFYQN